MIKENDFIDFLKNQFSPPTDLPIKGIGDDCALFPHPKNNFHYLITQDLLLDGIHFDLAYTSPEQLAQKSLAVNLSDIAAMGGRPLYVMSSLAIPLNFDQDFIKKFYLKVGDILSSHGLYLLGGDTVRSPHRLSVDITLIGEVSSDHLKLRQGMKNGDTIYIDGYIGDSALGLRLLQQKKSSQKIKSINSSTQNLLKARHLTPRPHLEEGEFLGQQPEVHCLMDLSDGLYQDLQRLAQMNKSEITIDLKKIPLSPETSAHITPQEAICGGEDYVLLFSVDNQRAKELEIKFFNQFQRPLYSIGQVIGQTQGKVRYLDEAGREIDIEDQSFYHFD